jgi:CarD family transcriptional regulator, regulator of rRNA transcription
VSARRLSAGDPDLNDERRRREIARDEKAELEYPGVGDTVVYAAHGIGRVVARDQKQIGGAERECIVVDLDTGLRVTLSLEQAGERLRNMADEKELEEVRRTLVAESALRESRWTARIKESKAKLAGGRPAELAEVVRDGSRFELHRGAQMSHAERRVYLQARELLIREISSARGMEQNEAEAWIEDQIAQPDGSGD